MKILTAEEIEGQRYYTLMGGLKGFLMGGAISFAGYKLLPRKFPHLNLKALPWSIKTGFSIVPPVALTAIMAEEGSNKFDQLTYGSGTASEDAIEDAKRWSNLSFKDRCLESFMNNRYKIVVGVWAASLWGSWELINRDKIMTVSQKAVQARMYAQFISVILLLGTMMISMYDNKLRPNQHELNEKKRWERVLKVAEESEKEQREFLNWCHGFASNAERKEAKIFKYD
ncbi:hypothetical protein TPHA_0D03770 [Tetrapisispora phaffii CBS 4417]|uniref:HIG1 domain-containing protein n=1 Tax=Tetrapisispora phaffii (strain ATCC 24235 / CBS 4417 / NBRC 1672 / NRRL Y-8282 / UCD 70-5) TaxID=1071381 RepID=G8BT39_TETPH|nr:hypothetical protein TPHA_0D03770 [Tetrapisispora phaffii CBS 4417]CCE63010.1 hypothetical protein TPHA_0D03770 [Tetrapisispora phaffii CBS 4417]